MGTRTESTICVGCGKLIEQFNSPFGICADCNPVRYDLKADDNVLADPDGKYRMAEPLPHVDRPSAVVRCEKTKRYAIFDPQEVKVWGIRPYRTYDGLHPSANNGVLSITIPNIFVRLWYATSWKLRMR